MVAGLQSRGSVVVGSVTAGMSAEEAGMLRGDTIVEFAGAEVLSRGHLVELVDAQQGNTVPVTVSRKVDGERVTVTMPVTPEYDEAAQMTRIGIMFSRSESVVDSDIKIHPRPGDQLRHHASAIFRFLGSLLTPEKAAKAANMVGGPVAILSYYVGIIKTSIMLAVWFTGFLNVNLAVINLLPMPVLDGGHIMFSLWEMVTRRPPRPKVVNALVNAFAVLLISLFVFLSIRDFDRHTPVGRFVRGLLRPAAEEVEEVEEVAEVEEE